MEIMFIRTIPASYHDYYCNHVLGILSTQASLPETRDLPSAKNFAEYQISDTRQNMTLSKDLHSAKAVFAECLRQTLGKDW